MTKTKIEWATEVWNPVTGCTKVSEGCRHCYAERIAGRFWGERKFTDVRVHPERLEDPLRWKKPRRVFVNSMSDLFHPAVDDDCIEDIFRVMARTPRHTYMVLTKRPEQMRAWFEGYDAVRPLPNVWLGVSVENQKAADERIPLLLGTPAAVRFVSCEPLLGPVKLAEYLPMYDPTQHYARPEGHDKLDWVIAGGESGPGARPMHPDWARGLRDVCQLAQTPFFFKQWGEWWPQGPQYGDTDSVVRFEDRSELEDYTARFEICLENSGSTPVSIDWADNDRPGYGTYHIFQPRPDLNPWWMLRTGKKAAGRELDGRMWEEFPR